LKYLNIPFDWNYLISYGCINAWFARLPWEFEILIFITKEMKHRKISKSITQSIILEYALNKV